MPTLDEIVGPLPIDPQQSVSQLHSALADGTAELSGGQEVSFVPYCRVVLPVDGWVFWLKASLLSPAQLAQHGLQTAAPIQVQGSLHYASVGTQEAEQSLVVRKVVFSAMAPIEAIATAQPSPVPAQAAIAPSVLYVAEWPVVGQGSFRFAFSERTYFYEEANEYHYSGDAVYPVFDQILIDTLDGFDQRPIVSNSLPIWLSIFGGNVPFPSLVAPQLPVFPAWLIPSNQPAPYLAVEIPSSSTKTLQLAPVIDSVGSHWNLESERVRITMFGLRNDDAISVQNYLYSCADLSGLYGLMEPVNLVDDHHPQVELATLAQKKTIEFVISYYQVAMRDLSRQVIQSALPGSFEINPVPVKLPDYPAYN